MKKFMLGLAIAAVGSAFAVESSNVVGYTSKTVTADTFYMMCAQFQGVNESGTLSLNDIMKMSGVKAVAWADNLDGVAAQITVREGDFYVSYYYISDAFRPGTEIEIGYDTWATSAGEAVTAIATPQEGMWMRFPGNSGSVIFSK